MMTNGAGCMAGTLVMISMQFEQGFERPLE